MARTALRRVMTALGTPDQASDTDAQLLHRYAREADEAAFALLVRRHAGLVNGVCRRALSHAADAEDATQAVFVLLAQKAKAGRWQASIANWLHATARKVSATARRSAARRATRERRAATPEATSPIDQMTGRELLAVLDEELAALPARYREPLILCHLDDLSRENAAKRLGIAVGTVKIRLERGKKKLATALESRGVTLGVGLLTLGTVSAASSNIDPILAAVGHPPAPVAALVHEVSAMTWFKPALLAATAAVALLAGTLGLGNRPATAEDQPKPAMKADTTKAKPTDPKRPTSVAGTVVGPDGKPVEGATVHVLHRSGQRTSDERAVASKVATTAADGTFRADVPKDVPAFFWVLATKAGLGVAWEEPKYPARTLADPEKLAFRLVKDQPITGRVLDTEGKPVAGLTVGVIDVIEPLNGDFDRMRKAAEKGDFGMSGQWEKVLHLPPSLGHTTTDKDGKFAMAGLGADRVVGLAVHGKGYARMSGFVFNRAGVKTDEMNRKHSAGVRTTSGVHPVFYPTTPTFVVGPGYAVEGTVTNRATGKPVPDCSVSTNTGFWDHVEVKTDAAGKYRLDGLSKGSRHGVHVSPTNTSAVFATWADVKAPAGGKAVTLDFALAKGAIFTGKAIDKETKEPVAASFQIIPSADNEYAKQPEYETASRDHVWKGGGADGKFRIVTLPGKSKANINVAPTQTLHGHPFHPYRPGQSLEIDLPADGEKEITVEIERGKTAEVAVVDADGKPLTGLVTNGQTVRDHGFVVESETVRLPMGDSKLTVYGLGDTVSRQIAVLQPEKKLGGALKVTAGAAEKLVLHPLQSVRGTFTDTDGKPLAGLTVTVDYEGYGIGAEFTAHVKADLTAKTDAAGKFEIPNVVPGLPFTFLILRGQTQYGGVPKLGQRVVEPGKSLEVGVRKLEILE